MGNYTNDAVELLMELIAIPSVSRSEDQAADKLSEYLRSYKKSLPDDSAIVFCANRTVNTLNRVDKNTVGQAVNHVQTAYAVGIIARICDNECHTRRSNSNDS